jgi:hypothetical protein
MLAGNLASIGVGGIVAWGTSALWPENYDFGSTRAMNAPAGSRFLPQGRTHVGERKVSDEGVKRDEKSGASASVESVQDGTSLAVPDESDLEPEALRKAFKFAAWSSLVLVSVTHLRNDMWQMSLSKEMTNNKYPLFFYVSSWYSLSSFRSPSFSHGPCMALLGSPRGR